jgi:hypothetical protein
MIPFCSSFIFITKTHKIKISLDSFIFGFIAVHQISYILIDQNITPFDQSVVSDYYTFAINDNFIPEEEEEEEDVDGCEEDLEEDSRGNPNENNFETNEETDSNYSQNELDPEYDPMTVTTKADPEIPMGLLLVH